MNVFCILFAALLASAIAFRAPAGPHALMREQLQCQRPSGKDSASDRIRYLDSSRDFTYSVAAGLSALGVLNSPAVWARNEPEVTHRVSIEVKIANYTEESIGSNRGAKGSGVLVVGLYGKEAPAMVKRFLDTVAGDGETKPDYYNSQFSKVTDDHLLEIECVRGIHHVTIGGNEGFEYKGSFLPDYKPVVEANSLRHDVAGLLTHRALGVGPEVDGFNLFFSILLFF